MAKNVVAKNWQNMTIGTDGRRYSDPSQAPSPGTGGNTGFIGGYATLDLEAHPIYTVNMSLNDYVSHHNAQNGGAGTGTTTHVASGWWDNSAYARIIPPTADGLERGIQGYNLYKNATLGIQDFNLRFEQRFGPAVALFGTTTTGPKHSIIWTRRQLDVGNAEDRPIYYLGPVSTADNASYNRANTLSYAPGQGTWAGWSNAVYDSSTVFDNPPGTLTFYPNGPQGVYFTTQGDSGTFQGKPLIQSNEFITIEYRVITISTGSYPRGLIAYRVYTRSGGIFERGIPFDHNPPGTIPLGGYVTQVQQFGCGEWNQAPTAGADMWFDVGGMFTFARNFNGWLGPRTGFVQ